MKDRAAELLALFEAECRRVGVDFDEVLYADVLPPTNKGDLRGIGVDIAPALAVLRSLPTNAGEQLFQLRMRSDYLEFGARENRDLYPLPSHSSLATIAAHEEYLFTFVTLLVGDALERDRALERRGVYAQYSNIFEAYLWDSGDGVEGIEALRRATFLAWCSATQPACFTGVGEFTESQEEGLVTDLERACAQEDLDPQLRWMLGYYHGAYPEVFGRFLSARALQRVLKRTFPQSWRIAEPEPRHFAGRGLMGRFWTQLVATA